jgi:hypothetical protein
MGRRGNLMFGKSILQSNLRFIGGDCSPALHQTQCGASVVAHLHWRAVSGKIAPRNDIKKDFL